MINQAEVTCLLLCIVPFNFKVLMSVSEEALLAIVAGKLPLLFIHYVFNSCSCKARCRLFKTPLRQKDPEWQRFRQPHHIWQATWLPLPVFFLKCKSNNMIFLVEILLWLLITLKIKFILLNMSCAISFWVLPLTQL